MPRLPQRRSQSTAALVTGVRVARAPLIATLDGDGQNPLDELPKLIEHHRRAAAGSTLVAGWRRGRNDNRLCRTNR